MKRIINGVTYNTATSTALALKHGHQAASHSHRESDWIATLYQTHGGAYFLVYRDEYVEWNQQRKTSEAREDIRFEPMSPEAAQTWFRQGEVEVLHNPFHHRRRGARGAKTSTTIYVRVPASLKRRVDEEAAKGKVSANQWVMRAIERAFEMPATEA
jgi:predicted HicB family RNase H-like nuclease